MARTLARKPAAPAPLALSIEERAPLSVAVARRLRAVIVSGGVLAGEEMPSEKELCRQLGVGRSTVREALRILQAQGLLSGGDTVSTARPRVSPEHTMASAAHTMENALALGRIPLADLVALRVVIEAEIVVAAAEKPDKDLTGARAALEAMRAPGIDVVAFRAADLRFHRELAALAGNEAYALVMSVLRDAIGRHLGEALDRVRDPRAAIAALTDEHAHILDAIARGHGRRARELVTAHIRDFYQARPR